MSARKLPEYPKNIPGSRREEGLLQSWYSYVESLLGWTGAPCPASMGQHTTTSGKRKILSLPQECTWREAKGCQDGDMFLIGITWSITSIWINLDTHEYWEYCKTVLLDRIPDFAFFFFFFPPTESTLKMHKLQWGVNLMSRFHFGKIFPRTAQLLAICISYGDFTHAHYELQPGQIFQT